jgi:GxxExxY protein
MNTDCLLKESRLIYGELTHKIIGSATEVLNVLGFGVNEKCYENALVHEFSLKSIPVNQQSRFDVIYKGVAVGSFIPDLIVDESIIVDAKCIERITEQELGQMINYLRITKLTVGLILNFKHAKLEWQRVVL